ncbi:hypothetical protein [Serratia ureilytica]|uniref:hypothetical protein n=1 Tax=Serratia ureilytica TaxID=300181 RepID=UPI00313B67C2
MTQLNKLTSAVIFALPFIATAAFAAGSPDANTITTTSADLNFAQQTGFRHVLIPRQGYFSGALANGTVLADGTADSGDGAPSFYATRFTQGSTTTPNPSQPSRAELTLGTVTGTNDPSHKLVIGLDTQANCSANTANFERESDGWTHCKNTVSNTSISWRYVIYANGAQSVAADVYNVSVDAAGWVF